MGRYAAGYAAAAVVMVALDMVWLRVVAKSMYQEAIGHLMADRPNVWAAVVFYGLYPIGLLIFAVAPNGTDPAWGRTLVMGALFGLFAYSTYDLSNLATLRNWPVGWSAVDIAWGTGLTAVAALAGKAAMNWATRG